MRPVDPRPGPGERAVIYAEDQEQYARLPSAVTPAGVVRTEWSPTPEELAQLAAGGTVSLELWTFGEPLQPIRMTVRDPMLYGDRREPEPRGVITMKGGGR